MNLGEQILGLFDDPSAIWSRIFETQLDELTQRTFLTLATLPEPVELEELEAIVRSQILSSVVPSLDATLKGLDDTFITIASHSGWSKDQRKYEKADRAVGFRNPGLLDFAQALIEAQPGRLAALEPLARFEQLQEVLDLAFANLSGQPAFPRTRKYVCEKGEHYLGLTLTLFFVEPCVLGGLRDESRFRALIRATQRLRTWAADGFTDASNAMGLAWEVLMLEPPHLAAAEFLASPGVVDLLEEVLGDNPVETYAALAASLDPSFEKMQILEELRRVQDLTLDEASVRDDFEAFLRQRLEALDEDDDHDSLRGELSKLEDLGYWMSDGLWGDAMVAFEARVEATSEGGDDYQEDSRSTGTDKGASGAEPAADDYLGELFGGLVGEG